VTLPDALAAVLVAVLTAYAVLGGADFGTGIWDLTAPAGPFGERVRALLKRSMGPVWEANHVWLIFALVIFWTGFPRAFAAVASTLGVPLFLAAVGIILRGCAFAFRGAFAGTRAEPALRTVFALSSIITPFFMGTVVGAIASGRVPLGNAGGEPLTSWWNPTSVAVGLIAVATGAYLAAVYTAADAARTGLPDLVAAFRRRGLIAGAAAGALAAAGLLVLRWDARPLFDALAEEGLPLVALSGAAGIATLVLLWLGRLGAARLSAAVAVAAVLCAWAVAQHPALLPGQITVAEAAANRATLVALFIGGAIGALTLVPSLLWLFRLALSGRLSEEIGPPAEGEGTLR
jgi:cytochrome d ubiquinol oxidase subunit II